MKLRTYKRVGFLAPAFLLVCVLAALLLRSGLPKYNGQSLMFWFKNLPNSTIPASGAVTYRIAVFGGPLGQKGPSEADAHEALVAIRAMGTNALPFLIHKLKQRGPRPAFDPVVRSYSRKLPVIQNLLPTDHETFVEQQQAVTGLLALCPLPPDTVNELRKLSLDFQSPGWSLAGDILRANDDPGLRDIALNSYFEEQATIKRFKNAGAYVHY
jgi:hypothetical protein